MAAFQHPLDLVFLNPQRGTQYLMTELGIGTVWSCAVAVPSILFLYLYSTLCFRCDKLLTYWLYASALLRLMDLPLKLLLWIRLSRISRMLSIEDRRLTTRKLMKVVRQGTYRLLTKFSLASYITLLVGFVRVWQQETCARCFPTFYHLSLVVICFSVLRFLMGVVRLYSEISTAERRYTGESGSFLYTGATLEQIDALSVITLTPDLMVESVSVQGQYCSICIEEFRTGDLVKRLACSPGHVFHQSCIDRWLLEVQACPLCASNLQSKKDD